MTLAAAVAPLAAFALAFQTIVYLSMPARLRLTWAPVIIGGVGALLTIAAGLLFGFGRIGLTGGEPTQVLGWGMGAVAVTALGAITLISWSSRRAGVVDPRLASMTPVQALTRILVRIPLLTALIEEAVFRGVLHAALIAIYPAPLALWLGAGLFGLWHIGPGLDQAAANGHSAPARLTHTAVTVVATTLAGAFLVWLRMETGSIWAPAAVHAAVNMTMTASLWSASRAAGRWGAQPS